MLATGYVKTLGKVLRDLDRRTGAHTAHINVGKKGGWNLQAGAAKDRDAMANWPCMHACMNLPSAAGGIASHR